MSSTRDKQRYRYIRYLAEMQGLTVRDLHREYCAESNRCHYSVFYRVCKNERKSAAIRNWIARRLKIRSKELWS